MVMDVAATGLQDRLMRRLRLFALIPVMSVLCGAALSGANALAAPTDDPDPASPTTVTTLIDSGTYSYNFGTRDSQQNCGTTTSYSFSWKETAVTTDKNLYDGVPVYFHFDSLSGTESYEGDASPACDNFPPQPQCSGPISLRPGWEDSNSGEASITMIWSYGDGPNQYDANASSPLYGRTTISPCDGDQTPYDNSHGREGGPLKDSVMNVLGGTTTSDSSKIDQDSDTPAPNGDGTTFQHIHGSATMTIQAGQTGTKPPADDTAARKARQNAKAVAKADLEPALENAKGPCLNYLMGLGSFGAGSLLLGTPAVGPTLIVAGSLTALAAEPFCVATISRIAKDYTIYQDPPDYRIHHIAKVSRVKGIKLPKCKQHNRAARTFCKELRPALAKWVTKAQLLSSTLKALSTTVNRLTAAITSHSASGEVTQTKQEKALVTATRSDKKSLRSSGKKLASIYRHAKLRMPLSHQRAKQAEHVVLSKLSKADVSAKQLRAVSSTLLSTKSFDGLKALAAG
jgi:hypothetical protein